MTEIRKLREQIDACRPGSDDLALPALADLAAAADRDAAVAAELARSQRFDQAVSVALHELPVPAGLMERMLAATETNRPAPAVPATRFWQRRPWLTAIGSVAATFLLAVTALWLAPRTPRQVSQEDLGQAVGAWYSAVVPAAEWQTGKLPAGFSKPSNVIPAPVRWRRLTASHNGWSVHGVAMELNPPTLPRATLFVVSSPVRFNVPAQPPRTAMTFTGVAGAKAIAWQNPKTKLLYVLVFEGDRGQRLEHLVRQLPQA
jgi:hypothetical protein